MELPRHSLLLSTVALCCAFVQGENFGTCETNSGEYIDGDGLFEVYTFEVAEGILSHERNIIGTIILSGNSTNKYTFDEPYFKPPYNVKTEAQQRRFDVDFINISPSGEAPTQAPRINRGDARTPFNFSSQTDKSSGHYDNGSTMALNALAATSSYSMLWSATTNVSAKAMTLSSSTPEPPVNCVAAQIVQIYDLDREESDTHYLTIIDNDSEWPFPLVVMVKVKDINDNSPAFVKESLSSQITKDVEIGEVVAKIEATDADIGINAELQYEILNYTERRGNETEHPDKPTFIIQGDLGLVVLSSPLDNLESPTQITFSVVVKDHGSASNQATATATISIVNDGWTATDPVTKSPYRSTVTIPITNDGWTSKDPDSKSLSGGVIAGCVLGGVICIGLLMFIVFRCTKYQIQRGDVQSELMLDDENLISA